MNRLLFFAIFAALIYILGEISWTLVIISLIILITMAIYSLYHGQEQLLFQPRIHPEYIHPKQNPQMLRHPMEHGMKYENIYIKTEDDIKLHCWFIYQDDQANHPTVVFFHANAGNMGMRLPNIVSFYNLLKCNIFIVSYRGYGESGGTPNEDGLKLDGRAAMNWILNNKNINHDKIVVFGRSLGGAVAIHVAYEFQKYIRALIIENTFTNISDMVDILLPWLTPIKKYLLRMNFPSIQRIESIKLPILFLSGLQDEVVPANMMYRLYENANNSIRRTIVKFPLGHHNDTWLCQGYNEAVKQFYNEFIYPNNINNYDNE